MLPTMPMQHAHHRVGPTLSHGPTHEPLQTGLWLLCGLGAPEHSRSPQVGKAELGISQRCPWIRLLPETAAPSASIHRASGSVLSSFHSCASGQMGFTARHPGGGCACGCACGWRRCAHCQRIRDFRDGIPRLAAAAAVPDDGLRLARVLWDCSQRLDNLALIGELRRELHAS